MYDLIKRRKVDKSAWLYAYLQRIYNHGHNILRLRYLTKFSFHGSETKRDY